MVNGKGEPQITIFFPNPFLTDDDGIAEQPRLGVMSMTVQRNAYGRQRDSFETSLRFPMLGPHPVPAVFIRAPGILSVGEGIDVLATLPQTNGIVAARQGRLLATTFHPELTSDDRLHRYFLDL
ncbi:MAG: hypothetical protein HC829_05530 [Bacteroidales bacterium]|nr:hypothetical protein [Bacteroidales bacterium]